MYTEEGLWPKHLVFKRFNSKRTFYIHSTEGLTRVINIENYFPDDLHIASFIADRFGGKNKQTRYDPSNNWINVRTCFYAVLWDSVPMLKYLKQLKWMDNCDGCHGINTKELAQVLDHKGSMQFLGSSSSSIL